MQIRRCAVGVWVWLVLGAAVSLSACEGSHSSADQVDEKQAIKKSALAVSLLRPELQTWSERLTASGNMQPWQLVTISSEITGVRILDVPVGIGSVVKKGQLLARLDDASIRVDLSLNHANLEEARANQEQAKLFLERGKKLESAEAISQQELQQYETAVKTGAAKVSMAQAQVKATELRLRYTRILAPDDGVIVQSNASVGALSDSTRELFVLLRQGRLEWRAELRPEQQAKVFIGQKVLLTDPLGQKVEARVREIGPTVDLGSRTSLVYVDVQGGKVLKPGVLVTGEFVLPSRLVMAVPYSAVVLRDGFSYAMRVGKDRIVQPVKLSLGGRQGDWVEVISGLDPQDAIVLSGGNFLHQGDHVTVSKEGSAQTLSGDKATATVSELVAPSKENIVNVKEDGGAQGLSMSLDMKKKPQAAKGRGK